MSKKKNVAKVFSKKVKKKKRGFTLIELLAVIIILGVLMIVAIPSVTEYIQNSRKNAYVTTASQYISGAKTKVNSSELPMYDTNTTYYVPTSCVPLEKGGDSPFGELKSAYIVVTYDGDGYDYYWTSSDESNMGILLSYEGLLAEDSVESGITTIDTLIGVGEREYINIVDNNCNIGTEQLIAKMAIPEKGRLSDFGVSTLAELKDAVSKLDYVIMLNDIEITESININGITLDGGGNSLIYTGKSSGSIALLTTGGTIKNLNVKGAYRAMQSYNLNDGDLIVENCSLDGTYAFNAETGTRKMIFKNTTFNGWTSYQSTYSSVEFIGCKFGKGSTGYAFLRPYMETSLTGCEFAEGFKVDVQLAKINLSDCKLNGVVLNSSNIETLLDDTYYVNNVVFK